MATYIVGDIQGCFDQLQQLMDMIEFDEKNDQLWLTGDLVARGPKSLQTLRLAKDLGKSAKIILGNHDLHLLATYLGYFKTKRKDQTQAILDAPDCDELMYWLRQQPLLASHSEHPFVMCHAGIYPKWSISQAQQYAAEIEQILRSDNYAWLIENMYGETPTSWNESLQGINRFKFIINSFTRMRYCTPTGELDMKCKLPDNEVDPKQLVPWFSLIKEQQHNQSIIFGHWASLVGYRDKNVIGLDTGCVWGHHMTMLRWEDQKEFTVRG